MKILFTSNKTYRGALDGGWWYFYLPLKSLGHDIYFYDTVEGCEKTYAEIIESFKPDLIFCIMTGDANIAPKEPWQDILKETQSGRTKTFNWFCDDTWRYDNFSKKVCHYFNVCSTPERFRVDDYQKDGYNNIIVANWHANSDFYQLKDFNNKTNEIAFIGFPTPSRKQFFDKTKVPLKFLSGISQEELFTEHCNTKIGVNLSKNDNDPFKKTQMKQRIFEIPAGGGLLMTEYHSGIEEYYKIDNEIITFSTIDEFAQKANYLLNNPAICKKISQNGYNRFLKEHESKIRLSKTIEKISQT
jgi:spore maturation protein CgeB